MIEHSISLIVDSEISKNLVRAWFRAVRDTAPTGVVTTVDVEGKPVQVVKSVDDGRVKYIVPLSRDLTDAETKPIIEAFAHHTDQTFGISTTSSPLDLKISPEVTVEHDPMIQLCTDWAKKKHEDWRKTKTDGGWRYGPTVSPNSKTHPLLRSWEEIPAEYRKVDTSQAQALLDLLKESGYVLIHHDDLDRLIGDGVR